MKNKPIGGIGVQRYCYETTTILGGYIGTKKTEGQSKQTGLCFFYNILFKNIVFHFFIFTDLL